MELIRYGQIVLRRWWLIAGLVAVVAVVAGDRTAWLIEETESRATSEPSEAGIRTKSCLTELLLVEAPTTRLVVWCL